MPARARLVIDGRIAVGAGGAVTVEARVRDPERGVVLATVSARAEALTAIDRAAGDLAAQLVPAVKQQLAAPAAAPARPEPRPRPVAPPPVNRRPVALVSVVHRVAFEPAMEIAETLARRAGYRPRCCRRPRARRRRCRS